MATKEYAAVEEVKREVMYLKELCKAKRLTQIKMSKDESAVIFGNNPLYSVSVIVNLGGTTKGYTIKQIKKEKDNLAVLAVTKKFYTEEVKVVEGVPVTTKVLDHQDTFHYLYVPQESDTISWED